MVQLLLDHGADVNADGGNPLAATAQIPLTELHHSGKIIVLVRKGAFNYPTTSDCSEQSLGLTCSHDQTWTGTLTMPRG